MPKKTKDEINNQEGTKKKTKTTTKKAVATSSAKKAPVKKTSASKATTKKTTSVTKTKTATHSSTTTTKKKPTKTASKKATVIKKVKQYQPEYYDLPYEYHNTVVKALAQSPNMLFVYWEISEQDRQNFIQFYGENFFQTTKPILIVHNQKNGQSFEVEIDDFANNWYIPVEDAKCEYIIELGRRPIPQEDFNKTIPQYVYITSSNTIESPNDHVLFFHESQKVHFRNIQTNTIEEVILPHTKEWQEKMQEIYQDYQLQPGTTNHLDLTNPTSTFQ